MYIVKCICALRVSEKQDNVKEFVWSVSMVPGSVDISLYLLGVLLENAQRCPFKIHTTTISYVVSSAFHQINRTKP